MFCRRIARISYSKVLRPTSRNCFMKRSLSTQLKNDEMKSYTPIQQENCKDVGLKSFMSKVYTRMGLGVTSSMSISLACSFSHSSSFFHIDPLMAMGVGVATSIASIVGISYINPIYKSRYNGNELVHYSENKSLRELSFWGLTAGMGLTTYPLVHACMMIDPVIIPTSVGFSMAIFGGCAYYSTKCKDVQMMNWKAPLMIGLGSLIASQVIGIGSTLLFGPNPLSFLASNIDIYGGLVLFTGMSIYDSYMARQMYMNQNPDHIACATEIYLDVMNILVRIMAILAKNKSEEK